MKAQGESLKVAVYLFGSLVATKVHFTAEGSDHEYSVVTSPSAH